MQQGNGQTAEALALGMMEDVCNLAENDTIKAEMEHHVNSLRDAIDKLSNMEPSVPIESSGNTFYSHGNSRQFNNTPMGVLRTTIQVVANKSMVISVGLCILTDSR